MFRSSISAVLAMVMAGPACSAAAATPSSDEDARTVAALDIAYQEAVKRNDADAMAHILADDMILVTGRGNVYTRDDLLDEARTKQTVYERQDEVEGTQTVRVHGDTAVVTAQLWIKGTQQDGSAIDVKLWFSDTYVRTADGWKYWFGQSSIPLPKE